MKAILVIDMPNTCNECPLMAWSDDDNWLGCYLTNKQTGVWCAEVGKPVDCPLKPMPKRKSIELACQKEDEGNDYGAGLIVGWNDCLEALEDSQNGEDSNE